MHVRRSDLKFLTAFVIAADTGLTSVQIVRLRPDQIDEHGRSFILSAKQVARKTPIPDRTWAALLSWREFCLINGDNMSEYVFGSVNKKGAAFETTGFRR